MFSSSNAFTNGRAIFILCYTSDSMPITGFKWAQTTMGDYTADGAKYNGIGLYSISGTTATKITETNNDSNIWKLALATVGIKNLPTPVIIPPGYYYTAVLYNSTGQVAIPSIASNAAGYVVGYGQGQGFSNPTTIGLVSTLNGVSTLPATVNMTTFFSTSAWVPGVIGY